MPLPSPAARGASSWRSWRTPSTDSNAPADDGSLATCSVLVACTAIVPGVPSGSRTIQHGIPPTRRRPATVSCCPHNG